jgi:hypothetical protein
MLRNSSIDHIFRFHLIDNLVLELGLNYFVYNELVALMNSQILYDLCIIV